MESDVDPLTGLEEPAGAKTVRRGSAIGYIDLRDFRNRVNVPYGHEVGDRALQTVAGRLRDDLAPLRVFRVAGTDFLVEIDRPIDEDGAADLARRIADVIAQPIDGVAEPLEAWIGITLRRVIDDVTPIRIEAERAANVLAPAAGLPFVVMTGRQ
jgi:GGDEF domain-containing protein